MVMVARFDQLFGDIQFFIGKIRIDGFPEFFFEHARNVHVIVVEFARNVAEAVDLGQIVVDIVDDAVVQRLFAVDQRRGVVLV